MSPLLPSDGPAPDAEPADILAPDVQAPDVQAPDVQAPYVPASDDAAPTPEPRFSAPPSLPPQERFRLLEEIKDNLAAFTIALIMALVIKHFCVEAFKIPTGSMEPTLLGEDNHPPGDRILVDKLAYLTHGPERWDVIVFLFPLDKSKHFIKRVAGLGGEWFRVVAGNVWVRKTKDEPWHMTTKPRQVREELYLPVFPVEADGVSVAESFWDAGEGWDVEAMGRLHFGGGDATAIRLRKQFGKTSSNGWEDIRASGSQMGDVRFRCRLVPENDATVTIRWSRGADDEASFHLSTGTEDAYAAVRRPGHAVREPFAFHWSAGQALDIELECVDGQVHVHVGGRELAVLDEARGIDDIRALDDFSQTFEIVAEGGPLEIEDFRVDRDIYYDPSGDMEYFHTGEEGLYIPEDHYFVMGDNVGSSADSRKWTLYHVPLEDGSEVIYHYDSRDPPRREGDRQIVTDYDGLERSWRDGDVESQGRRSERAPFVARRLIVGRAFLKFWPIFPNFPNRLGRIR